jgi:hypothetical protein
MLPGSLDLDGINLALCVAEQPVAEARDSFLVGAVPRLLPVPVRDGVKASRATIQAVTSSMSARSACC